MAAPTSGLYVAPHLRGGKKPTTLDYKTVYKLQNKIESLGYAKGSGGGDYYFPPNKHPHIHLRINKWDAWMVFSEGKQDQGISSVRMYDKGKLWDFQLGLKYLIEDRGTEYTAERLEDAVYEAASVLNLARW